MSELTLNVTRTIKAPIEAVYSAWLDPNMLAQFMLPGEGMHVPKSETDAREGGRFTIVMAAGEQEIPHGGEYLKLNPYSQIVFTWESPYSVDDSTVTLNLTENEVGTDIELIHVKFPNEEVRDNHAAGWGSILAALEKVMGS